MVNAGVLVAIRSSGGLDAAARVGEVIGRVLHRPGAVRVVLEGVRTAFEPRHGDAWADARTRTRAVRAASQRVVPPIVTNGAQTLAAVRQAPVGDDVPLSLVLVDARGLLLRLLRLLRLFLLVNFFGRPMIPLVLPVMEEDPPRGCVGALLAVSGDRRGGWTGTESPGTLAR